MRISLLPLLILLFCANGIAAQATSSKPIKTTKRTTVIGTTSPLIHIKFISSEDKKGVGENYTPEMVWLRLYNNSRWSIRLDTSGGVDRNSVRLYYDVVDNKESLIEQYRCHVCSVNMLKPGRSSLFGVPADRLSSGSLLRMKFSYSWENDIDVAMDLEPKHYVFFDSASLLQK